MVIKNLKFNDVVIHFPTINFKKVKNDKHKEEQEESLHDLGQSGSCGEIETLVREARLHFKDGGQ
jgi:hypothetical protein